MAYEAPESHYRLQFEDAAYQGLEVTVAEISVGELMELAELPAVIESMTGMEKAKAVLKLFTMIGESLVSWNLQRNGVPVPATIEGVKKQTLKFNLTIALAWMSAMAEVDIPLPQGSSNGVISPEVSLPMEPLSPSRGS